MDRKTFYTNLLLFWDTWESGIALGVRLDLWLVIIVLGSVGKEYRGIRIRSKCPGIPRVGVGVLILQGIRGYGVLKGQYPIPRTYWGTGIDFLRFFCKLNILNAIKWDENF